MAARLVIAYVRRCHVVAGAVWSPAHARAGLWSHAHTRAKPAVCAVFRQHHSTALLTLSCVHCTPVRQPLRLKLSLTHVPCQKTQNCDLRVRHFKNKTQSTTPIGVACGTRREIGTMIDVALCHRHSAPRRACRRTAGSEPYLASTREIPHFYTPSVLVGPGTLYTYFTTREPRSETGLRHVYRYIYTEAVPLANLSPPRSRPL
jgi:hypothetical protein